MIRLTRIIIDDEVTEYYSGVVEVHIINLRDGYRISVESYDDGNYGNCLAKITIDGKLWGEWNDDVVDVYFTSNDSGYNLSVDNYNNDYDDADYDDYDDDYDSDDSTVVINGKRVQVPSSQR